jgi:hypothetical protein
MTDQGQQPPRRQDPPGTTAFARAGRPTEPAPAYVPPASDEGSHVSGARIAATGGTPIL